MRSRFPTLFAPVWMAACTPDPASPDRFVPDDPDDPGTPLDTGDTSGAPEPERFALLEVVSSLVDDPTPWSDETGTTQLYAWKSVDLVRDGVDVWWTETVCGLESTEVFGTLTTYPDALVEAMPTAERSATLSEAATGATFTMEAQVTVLGAALDDPVTDPLPDEASDPEQWDQDNDGHPGVTVHVEQSLLGEGDVYVAQRTFTSYDGVLLSADRIEGYVDAETEQVIYEASTWWLEIDTNYRADPDPSHSFFIFRRIEDGMGCAEILDQRDTLFE